MANTPIRALDANSDYRDKLVKLIPSEIIMAFITIQGICESGGGSARPMQVTAIVLLILTPFYLWIVFMVKNPFQLVFTMVSLAVWIYNIAGQWVVGSWYSPVWASVSIVLWTLVIPLVPIENFNNPSAPAPAPNPNHNV